MEFGDLFLSIFKIIAIIAYIYGLLWAMGFKQLWAKILGIVVAFGIVQLALNFKILNSFDSGLLFQACTITMVTLGLNLIYGFNGQFSLGQYAFYGIGAYTAADITYRWMNSDASGLTVVMVGVALSGLFIFITSKFLGRFRRTPVLSSFTLYLIGVVIAGVLAYFIGNALASFISPNIGKAAHPGPLRSEWVIQIVYFLAVVLAGALAAIVAFLFGLPVLSLGSDYFGIATLGFTIVANTLMINSDTILPFPEMKGGRGMIGIPKLTTWFWAFFFMVVIIIIMRNLLQSSTGRAILSVREDETASKAMGINIANNKLLAFVIGSFFAGIGGGVYAHYMAFLSPSTFDFLAGYNPLIIVVFGGLGSMTGTITASFGWLFFLEGMLRVLLGKMGTDAPSWRYVLYPIALLLLMLLRPQGLLGSVEWGFLKSPVFAPFKKKQDTSANSAAN
ncbi:MAG: branched-chain amino acid ABC transporter permease [Anaerolineae bacterium]|nr:branched-chain amino acid ABC transporter permease [Anaerolineae bacterium]